VCVLSGAFHIGLKRKAMWRLTRYFILSSLEIERGAHKTWESRERLVLDSRKNKIFGNKEMLFLCPILYALGRVVCVRQGEFAQLRLEYVTQSKSKSERAIVCASVASKSESKAPSKTGV